MRKAVNKVLNRNIYSIRVSSLSSEGQQLTKDIAAEALNQQFVTVGPKLVEKLELKNSEGPLIKIDTQTKTLQFKLIDNIYVLNSISKLKNAKGPGPDSVYKRLIKDSGDSIWKPLTMIYNASLEMGVFRDI